MCLPDGPKPAKMGGTTRSDLGPQLVKAAQNDELSKLSSLLDQGAPVDFKVRRWRLPCVCMLVMMACDAFLDGFVETFRSIQWGPRRVTTGGVWVNEGLMVNFK